MFKDKLKELRRGRELTQEELAAKLFVSRSAVAKWEQGKGFPNEKSLSDICEFFEVSREELYNSNDVIETIEVVEKDYKVLNKRFLISICAACVLLVSTIVFAVIYFSSDKPEKLERGVMLSESYLEAHHLPNLVQPNGENKIVSGGRIYYCTVENNEAFHAYAEYLYNYLTSSPYISRLSFEVDRPIWSDPNVKRTYLMKGDDLSDFYYSALADSEWYKFYYFAELDSQRAEGDKVECYMITLHYGRFGFRDDTDSAWEYNNFYMLVDRADTLISRDIYLLEEYYDIHKLQLTNQNIDDYINYNSENIEDWFFSEGDKYIYRRNWWSHETDYYISLKMNLKIKLQYSYMVNGEAQYKEVDVILDYRNLTYPLLQLTPEDLGVESVANYNARETKILDVEVVGDSELIWCTRKFADESKYQ